MSTARAGRSERGGHWAAEFFWDAVDAAWFFLRSFAWIVPAALAVMLALAGLVAWVK